MRAHGGYPNSVDDIVRLNMTQNETVHALSCSLSKYLEGLCSARPGAVTLFASARPPTISIMGYTHRLVESLNLEPYHLIHVKYLLDKYASSRGASPTESHRLLATAVLLSIKYCDDRSRNDSAYVHVVGVHTKELVRLQFEFLEAIDYRLRS